MQNIAAVSHSKLVSLESHMKKQLSALGYEFCCCCCCCCCELAAMHTHASRFSTPKPISAPEVSLFGLAAKACIGCEFWLLRMLNSSHRCLSSARLALSHKPISAGAFTDYAAMKIVFAGWWPSLYWLCQPVQAAMQTPGRDFLGSCIVD